MSDTPTRLHTDERYRLAFEAEPAGVFFMDASGEIIDCNDALATILGAARADPRRQFVEGHGPAVAPVGRTGAPR